jgi:alkylation response protein AidB-like acyl-CoA dehydrogenase
LEFLWRRSWVDIKHLPGALAALRLVSEAKKMATAASWATVNDAMQVMGGIGYTEVFPVERMLPDLLFLGEHPSPHRFLVGFSVSPERLLPWADSMPG